MARIRTIKPEFPQSESMGRVSRDARLCFVMLWTISDDAGRLRGNSRMLASLLFPYDDDAKKLIDKWLAELVAEGCVTRYEINGDAYIQINQWALHQKIDKPTPSKIEPPTEKAREDSRGLAELSSDNKTHGEKTREESSGDLGREGKGREASRKRRATPLPEGFAISDRVRAWADEKGLNHLDKQLEAFLSYVKRKGATYTDWDEALMNAIRNDWAKAREGTPKDNDIFARGLS